MKELLELDLSELVSYRPILVSKEVLEIFQKKSIGLFAIEECKFITDEQWALISPYIYK